MCLDAERGVLAYLNAGCHEPVGVYARMEEGKTYHTGCRHVPAN